MQPVFLFLTVRWDIVMTCPSSSLSVRKMCFLRIRKIKAKFCGKELSAIFSDYVSRVIVTVVTRASVVILRNAFSHELSSKLRPTLGGYTPNLQTFFFKVLRFWMLIIIFCFPLTLDPKRVKISNRTRPIFQCNEIFVEFCVRVPWQMTEVACKISEIWFSHF